MKRLLALTVLLASIAQPALAGHTTDIVVYDPTTGDVLMTVIPTDDKALADPAFCGRKGQTAMADGRPCVQVKVTHGGNLDDTIDRAKAKDARIITPRDRQKQVQDSLILESAAGMSQ